MEENSSGDSVEEVSPTQNEVNDEDFREKTQQEIQFAELRYEGSLLQNSIWPEVLKIPLPTRPLSKQQTTCKQTSFSAAFEFG